MNKLAVMALGAIFSLSLASCGHSHVYGEYKKDAEYHWKECDCGEVEGRAKHDWDVGRIAQEATCEEAGLKIYKCNTCDAERSETLPALEHSYGSYEQDAVYHWKECATCDEVIGKEAHVFGEADLVRAATCTTRGLERYECATCHYVKEVETEVVPHQYGEWHVVTPPSCGVKGRKERTCSSCNHVDFADIDPLAHAYGELVSDDEFHWKECSLCGDVIERARHSFGEGEVTTAPTCSATGVRTYECSVCHQEKTESIPMVAHQYGEWTVTVQPTCSTAGTKTRTCAGCGDIETASVATTGHHYVSYVGTDKTGHIGTCEDCGVPSEKEAHSYVDGICSVCGFDNSYTHGLKYELYEGSKGTFYMVRGLGTATTEENIVIPSHYKGIEVQSIQGDFSLNEHTKSVVVPNTVTVMVNGIFRGASNLESLSVPFVGNSTTSPNKLAYLFDEDGNYPDNYNGLPTTLTHVEVTGTGEIAEDTFLGCKNVKSIKLSKDITHIKMQAFYQSGIESIDIPDSVGFVDSYAFARCESLKTMIFGKTTRFDKNVFYATTGSQVVLDKVLFRGNKAEWEEVKSNSNVTNSTMLNPTSGIYLYSETAPQEVGSFWHYGTDGETPEIWA